MPPIVSIIIPTYQNAGALQRCLDALLRQTVEDIEIVVVDDGSSDNTPDVIRVYSEKDSRVVGLRQENGGVSSARNKGLEKATGQWIAFVDSDDWTDEEYLSTLLPKDKDTDFVVSGYTEHKNGRAIVHQPNIQDSHLLTESAGTIEKLEQAAYLNAPWAKLFSKAIIDRHRLSFQPQYCYGEDKLFVYNYLRHCSRIEVVCGTCYHYDVQPGGLSRKIHPPQHIWEWNEDMLEAFDLAGKTFGWPHEVTSEMANRSFTYFTLYMADSIYHQPLTNTERYRFLKRVYRRRRAEGKFLKRYCNGKIQKFAATLYTMNSPLLSHIIYTLMCTREGKGMMR